MKQKLIVQLVSIIAAYFLNFSIALSQHEHHDECASEEYHEMLMRTDPDYKRDYLENEKNVYEHLKAKYAISPLTGPVQRKKAYRSRFKTAPKYVIPVVVHIIHDGTVNSKTDAQVTTMINEMNQMFRGDFAGDDPLIIDTEIEFCLASTDPNGNYTTGITRTDSPLSQNHVDFNDQSTHRDIRNLVEWPTTDYLNIWVVNDIIGAAGFSGVASQRGYFGSSLGKFLHAHEAGHTLGLSHTFQGGCVNNDCLLDNDRVCDTPPDDMKFGPCPNNTCVADDIDWSTNNPYRPVALGGLGDQNDHMSNVMDYAGGCMGEFGFTAGQRDRMYFFLEGHLNSWVTSTKCSPPCPAPIAINITLSGATTPVGTPITTTNSSVNAISHEWYVDGNLVSTASNPSLNFTTGGFHTIQYIAGNPANVSCAVDTTITIEALCVGLTVDFTVSADTITSGETVSFTNTTTGGDLHYWSLDGVLFDSVINTNLTLFTQGSYSISLEVLDTASNCSYSLSKTVVVECPVYVNFDPSVDIITSPKTITLTNTSSNATTFEWYIDGTFSSNSFNHTTFHGTFGNQVVTLIGDNGSCRDSVSRIITYMDTTTCSQNQVNRWYFGVEAGIDFSSGNGVAITDGAMTAQEGCATISNKYGNILFYTNGETVWDASHAPMLNGTGLFGDDDATHAAVIVPVPGSETNYYIFHMLSGTTEGGGQIVVPGALYYSEVDLTLNGGLGGIVPATKNTNLAANMTEKLAVARHADGCSFWVTAHEFNNDTFLTWLVDENGLNTTPVTSNIGINHGPDFESMQGQMKFSSNNEYLGLITSRIGPTVMNPPITPQGSYTEVFDFDNLTGQLTNLVLSSNKFFGSGYGFEFSPDNEKIYVTESEFNFQNIHQYQINLGTPAANDASQSYITSFQSTCNNCPGQGLQLGPDNIIYVTDSGGTSLHALTDPNNTAAPGFTQDYISLGGKLSTNSLPAMIGGTAGALDFDFQCTADGVQFSFTSTIPNIHIVHWNFGDGTTSSANSELHKYATNNQYTVTLQVYSMCQCATITKLVQCPTCTGGVGAPDAKIDVSPSGPICAGTPLSFSAIDTSGGGSTPSFEWLVNNATTGDLDMDYGPVVLNDNDVVSLVFTSSLCTAQSDTFHTTVNYIQDVVPSVSIRATDDTVCANSEVKFIVRDSINGGTDPSFQWYINGVASGTDYHTLTVPTIQVGDSIGVTMTSSALCPVPVTDSDGLKIVVLPNDNPDVQMTASANGICAGDNVVFTVTDSTGGGDDPTFAWYINGGLTAGDVNTINSSTLNNGDSISVIMTTGATCSTISSDTANITLNVQTTVVPSVTLTASSTNICPSDIVTFTVTDSTNGGSDPSFQWFMNGTPIAGDQNTYTALALNDQDSISVVMTSNSGCASPATDTSGVVITVNPNVIPSVQIASNPATICFGDIVTFSVIDSTGGGTDPSFQWQVNGITTGGDQNSISTAFSPGVNQVRIEMTSNATCPLVATVFRVENIIGNAKKSPNVGIAADQNPICIGETVQFTVTDSTDAGNDPSFQWYVNGTIVAGDQTSFTTTSLNDNDSVSVIITSNETCPDPTTDTANITMTVDPCAFFTDFTVDRNSICLNDTVYFTATATGLVAGDSLWWDFGSGSTPVTTDTGVGPLGVVYTTSGLKNIILYRTGSNPDTITKTGFITVNDYPTAIIDTVPDSISYCQGSTINLPAQTVAGATYQWYQNGSPIASGTSSTYPVITPGEYRVEISLNGCTSLSDSLLTFEIANVDPNVLIDADKDSICLNESISYTVVDSTNSGTNPTFTWFKNGTIVGAGVSYNDATLNNGDSILVVMQSTNQCQTDSLTASNVHYPYIHNSAGSLTSISGNLTPCVNESNISLTTDAISGSYLWSITSGDAIINSFTDNMANVSPGQVVSNINVQVFGTCDTASLDTILDPKQLPDPSFTIGNSTLCSGATTTLSIVSPTAGVVYDFYNNGFLIGSGDSITTANIGNYYVIAQDGGCDSTSTTAVIVDEVVSISASASPTLINQGEQSQLLVSGVYPAGSIINWTPSTTLSSSILVNPIAQPDSSTIYYVTVTGPSGCTDSDQTLVEVVLPIKIPNAFTPNDDGNNDSWVIEGLESYNNATLEVFNRWGSLVYKSSGNIVWWDGYRNGQVMPVATYYYILDLGITNDETDKYTGSVTLVR